MIKFDHVLTAIDNQAQENKGIIHNRNLSVNTIHPTVTDLNLLSICQRAWNQSKWFRLIILFAPYRLIKSWLIFSENTSHYKMIRLTDYVVLFRCWIWSTDSLHTGYWPHTHRTMRSKNWQFRNWNIVINTGFKRDLRFTIRHVFVPAVVGGLVSHAYRDILANYVKMFFSHLQKQKWYCVPRLMDALLPVGGTRGERTTIVKTIGCADAWT